MDARFGIVLLLVALGGPASAASIFDGDPVDPATGRPYAILPGVPLILPQPGRPDDFSPPIVDPSVRGDVDLVVRAAHLGVGPLMPPPVPVPPTAVAGGVRIAAGTEIPFTVIASTGGPGLGAPLATTELDGLPVVVVVFADLDGDGLVGPTDADPAGAADNGRELQEADFVVGRQVAFFSRGVAQGTVAVTKGAPASAGGLAVVLGAMAYVGPFRGGFFFGNVPDGPGVATLLPFFPRLDPDRLIEGNGSGGRAAPDVRLGVEIENAFDPLASDPLLGTPFALPTNGTSPTLDRAIVRSGPVSRVACVRPSVLASYPSDTETALRRGAGGALIEPLDSIDLADDGPGGGVRVRLVPLDVLDNVTDPPAGTTAILLAGPGLAITSPDTDTNPARETVALPTAAGLEITLDDTGGSRDSGTASVLTIVTAGVPGATLEVRFAGGGPGLPTTTTTTTGTTTTTVGGGTGTSPVIAAVAVSGEPTTFVIGCRGRRTIVAVLQNATGTATVETAVAVNGVATDRLTLVPGIAPPGVPLPLGAVFTQAFLPRPTAPGTLQLTTTARDSAGRRATPIVRSFPVVTTATPTVAATTITPDTVPAGRRQTIVVSARIADDCRVRSASVEVGTGFSFRRAGGLRDTGRGLDAVAGDGVFTGRARVSAYTPGAVTVRVVTRNALGVRAAGTPIDVRVIAP